MKQNILFHIQNITAGLLGLVCFVHPCTIPLIPGVPNTRATSRSELAGQGVGKSARAAPLVWAANTRAHAWSPICMSGRCVSSPLAQMDLHTLVRACHSHQTIPSPPPLLVRQAGKVGDCRCIPLLCTCLDPLFFPWIHASMVNVSFFPMPTLLFHLWKGLD